MTNYKLQIIPGTLEYVKSELTQKHPEVQITNEKAGEIEFNSDQNDIDSFNNLFSALRIEKENGLIRNLYRRDWKVESVPAGINPALAYVMCTLADIKESDTVLDPFCGAGTIAITASVYFAATKVIASDISGNAIDSIQRNVGEVNKSKLAKLNSKNFIVFRSNISQLRLNSGSVTKVITNLPFGIRTQNHNENIKIYNAFSEKMSSLLQPGSRIVALTQEKPLMEEVFSKSFKLIDKFDVDQGGLKPRIFVYNKV